MQQSRPSRNIQLLVKAYVLSDRPSPRAISADKPSGADTELGQVALEDTFGLDRGSDDLVLLVGASDVATKDRLELSDQLAILARKEPPVISIQMRAAWIRYVRTRTGLL